MQRAIRNDQREDNSQKGKRTKEDNKERKRDSKLKGKRPGR